MCVCVSLLACLLAWLVGWLACWLFVCLFVCLCVSSCHAACHVQSFELGPRWHPTPTRPDGSHKLQDTCHTTCLWSQIERASFALGCFGYRTHSNLITYNTGQGMRLVDQGRRMSFVQMWEAANPFENRTSELPVRLLLTPRQVFCLYFFAAARLA